MWSRVGTGSVGALIAAAGFAIGAALAGTPAALAGLDRLATPVPVAAGMDELLGAPRWLLVAGTLATISVLLHRRAPAGERLARPWPVTGLALGGVAVLAWIAGAPAGWGWGLSVTGPSRSLVEILLEGPRAANWGTAMLVGIPIGSWISARARGTVAWRPLPRRQGARRCAGGLLMGVGGTWAAGCNIGNALTGVSVLAVNSALAVVGMAAGVALALALAGIRTRLAWFPRVRRHA